MPTTGGALAFVGLVPPYEATLTKNLRDAGAVIIAKTGMTELANYVAAGMPTNYNAVHGYGFNPYDPRRDPRTDRRRAPGDADRRIELRHRHRGELLGRQRRQRNLRIDPEPVEPEHAGGDQADGRPHQPLRRDPDHRRSGHARADGEVRDGRGDHVRRARERVARSERSGDEDVHAAAGPRLHQAAAGRRPQGRAHRHPARQLLRPDHAAGVRSAARRPESRAEAGHGRGDRRAEGAGRDRRRRRHPEHRRRRSEGQPAARPGSRAC